MLCSEIFKKPFAIDVTSNDMVFQEHYYLSALPQQIQLCYVHKMIPIGLFGFQAVLGQTP